jgi:hypothetical protein
MLASPEYQHRVRRTLTAIESMLPLLSEPAASPAPAKLQAYATIRVLVDELLEISVADIESAGRATHGTATASEHIRRLLSACRSLAGLEESSDPATQHAASANEAVQALRGPHAYDVQG